VYLENGGKDGFSVSRGVGEPLAQDCACAALLREDASPLAVGPGEPGSVWPLLPSYDGRWIASTGSALLVPVARTGEALSGFISVGRKRSGMPFSSGELTYVSGIASAVALALSQHGELHQTIYEDDPARECVSCGRVASLGGTCACGDRTRVASVPAVLNGKFHVERRVGSGGMGVVYRAVDRTLDRQVALKTLSRLSASAAGRLAQEARVMAAVVHPHLATIYGVERWRGTPVLIVEYCERGTLADRLRGGRLPITETLRLGSSLATALAELHSAHVLHRDVKPSNIGFLTSGAAKLLDFGIAIYATVAAPVSVPEQTEASTQTQTIETRGRTIAGTPLYISPEVLRGAEADARVDLWALALVMYEALTGRHPFAAATVPEVLARVRRCRIPDLRESRPECSDALARAFQRWLARDAAQRPQTAADLAGDIEGLLRSAG
jgi:hypothetical protein